MMTDNETLTAMVREQRKALAWLLNQYNNGPAPQLEHAMEIFEITKEV